MKKIQQKTETNPLFVLRQAIRGVTPDIAVKARCVGGSTHQVPIEIGSAQGKALAIRWLLGASRKRPVYAMVPYFDRVQISKFDIFRYFFRPIADIK